MTPEPGSFNEPWHAQVFALTVVLSEAGHFQWADWTRALGATLTRHRGEGPLDGAGDYYAAWLETLEMLLSNSGLAPSAEVADIRDAWERAYLRTPHGRPVVLETDSYS